MESMPTLSVGRIKTFLVSRFWFLVTRHSAALRAAAAGAILTLITIVGLLAALVLPKMFHAVAIRTPR
jgi:hypothetical protein